MLKLYYGILRQSLHDSLWRSGLLLITSALMFVTASQATAHSGGTNRYGCHAGTKPCHCHTPKERIPLGIDPCSGRPFYTAPYRPPQPAKPHYPSKHRSAKNKVTGFCDKITGSISYGIRLIRKNPHIVRSCEEWTMIMKLMFITDIITHKRLASLERKCRNNGHRKFGRYMRKWIGENAH